MVDGCAYLTVPTRFLKSWIESHYTDRVLALYRAEAAHLERVVIAVRNGVGRDPSALRRPTEVPRLGPGPGPGRRARHGGDAKPYRPPPLRTNAATPTNSAARLSIPA